MIFLETDDTGETVTEKKDKEKENITSYNNETKKKIEYISTKKPVKKSIFYQHSKQGMKYWFEEKKSKPCK